MARLSSGCELCLGLSLELIINAFGRLDGCFVGIYSFCGLILFIGHVNTWYGNLDLANEAAEYSKSRMFGKAALTRRTVLRNMICVIAGNSEEFTANTVELVNHSSAQTIKDNITYIKGGAVRALGPLLGT
ncbi:hypothetical protein N7463_001463 [Penicillium fimorum]|uniref:Uncharacterized protein n=1 Tax=Penicillium fimorum TaxID=1882269 RepID=A0A9W9Y692_9EURO|nr:hypothetical protein N7463_001463 [Penicillium fimorum]